MKEWIEDLGSFYLGKHYDLDQGSLMEHQPFLVDSKDFTRHCVCLGMTGSGKTGLCMALIEEALMDRVPVMMIDPKGDLSNLLLNFPSFRGEDFKPWLDPNKAAQDGVSLEDYADLQAKKWQAGIESWGQSKERVQKLQQAFKPTIYSPGGSFGQPVNLLSSMQSPGKLEATQLQAHTDQLSSSLLYLLGEASTDSGGILHTFLSQILLHKWGQSKDLSFADLIREVQKPSFDRIGLMPVDTFISPKQRQDFAIKLNAMFASPGFSMWMQGTQLNIDELMWDHSQGQPKPKASIFSISHLSDEQRMFFVTRFLEETINWMRRQPGTSSLKAILYMDEIFGYLPPTQNPPSKLAFLTLLKQARAYGLGLVLASQNPADLDYKALSNIGTWFIGRLQTQRDKDKVIEGLRSAENGSAQSPAKLSEMIGALPKRVFVCRNVEDSQISLMHTRWVMSYLKGPLTETELKKFKSQDKSQAENLEAMHEKTEFETVASGDMSLPIIETELEQVYVYPQEYLPSSESLIFRPSIHASFSFQFKDPELGLEQSHKTHGFWSLWGDGKIEMQARSHDFRSKSIENAGYEVPEFQEDWVDPSSLNRSDRLKNRLGSLGFECYYSEQINQCSQIGESLEAFTAKIQQSLKEQRDQHVAALRQEYTAKLEKLASKMKKADEKVHREQQQFDNSKVKTWIDIGTGVLGALLGNKKLSARNVGRLGSILRKTNQSSKEKQDLSWPKEKCKNCPTVMRIWKKNSRTKSKQSKSRASVRRLPKKR